uniref:probable polypeptide N-acetylgalactosaminyltransferase 8 n=1 Tax=Monopterus albus TaxID=43700 RepID=UPI0009B445DC|nr:probable polypeptide N-acetylgalactosaminyltransferase 8 [Monopterus albus]
MRAVSFKRPVVLLVVISLFVCMTMFLNSGSLQTERTGREVDTLRMSRGFSVLEASIHNLSNILQSFEQKQDTIQKMLEDDRERLQKVAEVQQLLIQKQPTEEKQAKEKIQDQKEPPKEKTPKKLFPNSVLFKNWGDNLSEDDQREAQGLFEKYGYNVFLSDRLPLDRVLPDTRDPRYWLDKFLW